MQHMFSYKAFYMILFLIAGLVSFSTFNGCDDAGVEPPTTITNPNVRSIDSLYVEELFNYNSLSGLNLFNLTTVTQDSGASSRDAQLRDQDGSGMNFFLRSGEFTFLDLPVGAVTKFNKIFATYTPEEFDTISVIPVGRDTILPNLDFQWDSTSVKNDYFNVPLTEYPVFTFWLKGKSENFHGKNIYGIIQPREATDDGTFRMSFRVRININGENDFRKEIPNN